jgi:hypothetical protein
LRSYHQNQAAALRNQQPPDVFVNTAGISKAVIERSIRAVLVSTKGAATERQSLLGEESLLYQLKENEEAVTGEDVSSWKQLKEDTQLNETVRRRLIHEMLAEKGLVRPEAVVKRIYKDVLHADLDDPYLGLGNVLFANYPFAKEDKGQ